MVSPGKNPRVHKPREAGARTNRIAVAPAPRVETQIRRRKPAVPRAEVDPAVQLLLVRLEDMAAQMEEQTTGTGGKVDSSVEELRLRTLLDILGKFDGVDLAKLPFAARRHLWRLLGELATRNETIAKMWRDFREQNARRELESQIEELNTAFASRDEHRHERAARILDPLQPKQIMDLLQKWRAPDGSHPYRYLLRRSREQPTSGLRVAVRLLRIAYRSTADEKSPEADDAFAAEEVTWALARLIKMNFAPTVEEKRNRNTGQTFRKIVVNARAEEGWDVLRGQPASVVAGMRKAFREQNDGLDIVDWLIREVPRTEPMLRVVALLRTRLDHGDHIEIAMSLLAPGHRDEERVVTLLRKARTHELRVRIEQRFDAAFVGTGREPGQTTPDKLRQHIHAFDGIINDTAYHEIQALLYHEPTDAEELYLNLPRWTSTNDDKAFERISSIVKNGTSRRKLNEDWDKFVKGGLGGTVKPLTSRSIIDHLRHVFFGTDSETLRRLIAQYDALEERDPEPAETLKGWGIEWEIEDRNAEHDEERRINAAEADIAAVQPRFATHSVNDVIGAALRPANWRAAWRTFSPNDTATLNAIREIVAMLRQRVGRLRKREQAIENEHNLDDETRKRLVAHYHGAALAAEVESFRTRRSFSRHVADGDIKMTADQGQLAQLILADHVQKEPTAPGPREVPDLGERGQIAEAADEVYIAATHGQDRMLVSLVTGFWARGQLPYLYRDLADPIIGFDGGQVRRSYNLVEYLKDSKDKLSRDRIAPFVIGGMNEAKRGAARLDVEVNEIRSDTDVADIVNFLETQGLTTAARSAVVRDYVRTTAADFLMNARRDLAPEQVFLDWIWFILRNQEGEIPGENYERLKDVVAPPKTARARVDRAREHRAAGNSGAFRWAARAGADAYDFLTGRYLEEGVTREQDLIDFINHASPDELAALEAMTGATGRDALSELAFKEFKERRDERGALETTCAQLIAGMIETLVEAGLAPFTGGAGLAAVFNSMAAAVASIIAQEAMLGSGFKTVSVDNFNAVMLSGLQSGLNEVGLRDMYVDAARFEKAGNLGHQIRQDLVINTLTGASEGAILASAEMMSNVLLRDRWPSNDDIALTAKMMIDRFAEKIPGTPLTTLNAPNTVHAYTAAAERLRKSIMFRLGLKFFGAGGKVVVNAITKNQTLESTVADLLWKEARVGVTSVLTGLTRGNEALNVIEREKNQIARFQQHNPREFAHIMREMAAAQFEHPEKGPAMRAEFEAHVKQAGRHVSPADYILEKLTKPEGEPPNGAKGVNALLGKFHKDVLAQVRLFAGAGKEINDAPIGDNSLPGLARKSADELEQHDRERRGITRPRGGLGDQVGHAKTDIELYAALEALRHTTHMGNDEHDTVAARKWLEDLRLEQHPEQRPGYKEFKAIRDRYLDIIEKSARNEPKDFGKRYALLRGLREPANETRKRILAGEGPAIRNFMREHGSWTEAIAFLEAGDIGMLRVADQLQKCRAEMLALLGGKTDRNASTKRSSDMDVAFTGEDATQRMLHAQGLMVKWFDTGWRTMWHTNFYNDASYLYQYVDVIGSLGPDKRREVHKSLTEGTEKHGFAKMLEATKSNPKIAASVVRIAGEIGYDLTEARGLAEPTGKSERHKRLSDLAVKIDSDVKEYQTAEPEKRAGLAVQISLNQQAAAYLMKEAYLGPGASRSDLGARVKVYGAEAYQAALNHLMLYFEHRAERVSERQYEPYKYMSRIIDVMSVPGVDVSALAPFKAEAERIYKQNRKAYQKRIPRQPGAPFIPSRQLEQTLTAFEQALILPLAAMRSIAITDPEQSPVGGS